MDAALLPRLGHMLAATREQEVGCEDCFGVLDGYAERYAQGASPAALLPEVEHHMRLCPCCRDEFEALVRALRKTLK